MRNRVTSVVVLLLALSCAGLRAREHALWPQVASTWPAVHESIVVGLEGGAPSTLAAAAINQVEGAVRADDYRLLRGVDWTTIDFLARRGVQVRVDSGDASEGLSVSLLERIIKFSEAMQELTGR